jgi:hypothetical protein
MTLPNISLDTANAGDNVASHLKAQNDSICIESLSQARQAKMDYLKIIATDRVTRLVNFLPIGLPLEAHYDFFERMK